METHDEFRSEIDDYRAGSGDTEHYTDSRDTEACGDAYHILWRVTMLIKSPHSESDGKEKKSSWRYPVNEFVNRLLLLWDKSTLNRMTQKVNAILSKEAVIRLTHLYFQWLTNRLHHFHVHPADQPAIPMFCRAGHWVHEFDFPLFVCSQRCI